MEAEVESTSKKHPLEVWFFERASTGARRDFIRAVHELGEMSPDEIESWFYRLNENDQRIFIRETTAYVGCLTFEEAARQVDWGDPHASSAVHALCKPFWLDTRTHVLRPSN